MAGKGMSMSIQGVHTLKKKLTEDLVQKANGYNLVYWNYVEKKKDDVQAEFDSALYSTVERDVNVTHTRSGTFPRYQQVLTVEGKDALFIEYGAGIYQPLASYHAYARGEYGRKLGRRHKWVFRLNGRTPMPPTYYAKSKKDPVKWALTPGVPPANIMFRTRKEMREWIRSHYYKI